MMEEPERSIFSEWVDKCMETRYTSVQESLCNVL